MFKVSLLLLIISVYSDSWTDYIHQFLDEQINSEVSSETVWATGTLYYSSPDEYQDVILDYIVDEQIKSYLQGNSDLKDYIQQMSFHLEDEHLLLSYLLLEEDIERRTEIYESFYNNHPGLGLRELNDLVKDGEKLDEKSIANSTIGFEHFLISFHVSNNNVTSDEFFNRVKTLWQQAEGSSLIPTTSKSYQIASILKAYYETGEYGSINGLYNEFHHLQNLPHSKIKLNLLWGAEFALYRLGYVDKSLETQRKFTIPISSFLELNSTLNSILSSHGGYLYQIGKYQEAKTIFLSILDKAEELPESFRASLYNNLSLVYYKTGESSEYITAQLQALEIAKSLGNNDFQSRIYRNLHYYYSKNKNWDLANRYINEAAQLSSDNNNFEELASIYSAKSTFELHSLNNIQGAYKNLENATLLFDQFDNPRLKNRIEFELAELNLSTRQLDLSKSLFQGIKSRSVGDSDVSTYLEVNIKLAQISIIENDFIEARNLLKEIRAHDMTDLDFSVLILAQTVQAQIAQHFGDPLEADRLYSEAADLVFERSRNTSEAESGYWTVEEDYLYLFEKYADFLLDNELYTDALMLFDRIKTINDATLTENPLVRSSRQSEESLTEIQNLTQEMDRVRREILTSNDDNRLTLQNRLARLSAERKSLTESDQNKLESDPVNILSIQRQLRDSQTLLHLTEIGQNIFLAVLQRDDLQIKKLPLNNENRQLFEAATESILVGRTELDKLYRIGQLINIDDIASHSNSIIVMPDGYFHQLPIGVIPVQSPLSPYSYGSAQYLIEEAEVRTLNSLKDMTERAVRTDHQFGFSGFGVDDFQNEATSRSLVSLPKAPMEISSINQQLNRLNNNRTFINESATVSQFQQTAGNSKVLHMATHSEVSESDPLFSTLHFYADETENSEQVLTGRLFAYELFELNLQNDLIMLNSCESGGDRFLQGSGVMGISRALRYAGAKSLVLNSWSVNDQYAAEFAEEFYKHLNNGENKSRALQLAKVHFIKNKNANPHFWGPYILNGDNRPIVNSNKWFAGTLLLALVFLSGLVFTGRRKQQQAA